MQLEKINCPVCDDTDYSLFLKAKDFRLKTSGYIFNIVKCNKCDFIFLNPRPFKNEINHFYTLDFHKKDRTLLYKVIEPCFKIAQKSTIRLIKKYKNHGKMLDIGCGNGSFMLAMHNNGYDVWGIEPNHNARQFTDIRLDGRIIYKELQESMFYPKAFDIITMFHSLEHAYNLKRLFEKINLIIKDDGILYICIPNTDFFEARLFGSYYYNLEVPRHLYFFTKKSLSEILQKNEFKVKPLLNKSIFELILTPASLYYGIRNFLIDKNIIKNDNDIVKFLTYFTYIPFIIVRLFLCIFYIFERQNLEVICHPAKNENH